MRRPRVRLWPYKRGSRSARALAREMGVLRLRFLHRNFIPRQQDLIVNWGSRENPYPDHEGWLNRPENVAVAQNKLLTYQALSECSIPHPEFTTDRSIAAAWLTEDRSIQAFARKLLRASQGRGIVPIYGGTAYGEDGEEWPEAPLYVKYVKKRAEYRIHVMKIGENYEVIDAQEKRRRRGGESDSQVRNAANGWVFCREEVVVPDEAVAAAVGTVRALGLDFGAVDLGWNVHYSSPCVYECNTAPGLEGRSLPIYAGGILRCREARV